jgi:hypothetical protein
MANRATVLSTAPTKISTAGSDVHTIQQAGHQRRKREGAHNAEGNSNEGQAHALPHHHSAHIPWARSERHADANLLSPMLHGIRHHAIDADRGQEQSNPGEDVEEHHVEIGARSVFRPHLLHRPDVPHRQSAARDTKLWLDVGSERVGFHFGADDPRGRECTIT